MINVKKNFLSKEIHKDLFSVIQSDEFAWFHTKTLQKQKTNDIQFCHSLYHSNNVASNYFNNTYESIIKEFKNLQNRWNEKQ